MTPDDRRRAFCGAHIKAAGISLADMGCTLAPGSVKKLQRLVGVEPDGWIGPLTIAAWRRYNSQPVELDICRDWHLAARRPRRTPPKSIIQHDSGTRSAPACHTVLRRRNLSTHFLICETGKIYETVPPEKYTAAHCSRWNSNSIGVDVISMVSAKSLKPSIKSDRARLDRVIAQPYRPHNRPKKVVDYTDGQKHSLVALVGWLCDRFDIPRRIPTGPVDYGWHLDIEPDEYCGVAAHGQVSTKRWDGGLGVVALERAGWVADDERV